MTRYYVGIGSNENAEENCVAMINAVRTTFQKVAVSSVVRSAAFGHEKGVPDYINAVLRFDSDMTPGQLQSWCKTLEQKLGRTRASDGLCQADLDVLEPGLVEEPFFQPLVGQLITPGQQYVCEALPDDYQTVRLLIEDSHYVGLKPCELSD